MFTNNMLSSWYVKYSSRRLDEMGSPSIEKDHAVTWSQAEEGRVRTGEPQPRAVFQMDLQSISTQVRRETSVVSSQGQSSADISNPFFSRPIYV